jgi:activating signal cointegrator complex subunit 1
MVVITVLLNFVCPIFQAVKSPMLDYSHFISLPLAIHPDLVEKLNNFQSSILGLSAANVDSDKDESLGEDSTDENDEAESQGVLTKRRVEEEKSVDNKGSQAGLKLSYFFCANLSCRNSSTR